MRHRTSAVARAARAVLPLPVGLGAGLAVDGGRGPRSLPTRPAIIGAVAAVTGVVGCFGLLHGIDDALATPARSGQVWNAAAFPDSEQQFDQLRTIVRKDDAAARLRDPGTRTDDRRGRGHPGVRGHAAHRPPARSR